MTDQRPAPIAPERYTEEYFLTACEGYEDFLTSDGENLSRRLEAAFALAAVAPGMTVLDVACGRGEIVRHCARLGADACGFDYARAAIKLARGVIARDAGDTPGRMGLAQADAKHFPYPAHAFDRVLMFDIVEHLHPWELHAALLEAYRVLKDGGVLIIHTAPNAWYDRYAYPVVRLFRRLIGQGASYPADPRQFLVEHNRDVHVNEQSLLSLRRALRQAGFAGRVWLASPPQRRQEFIVLAALRHVLFHWPPFRWFFEREVFAVAGKRR
ncbi:MAG: methyltransferase domain-containing protein [Anaerolineae bacterium]|nr:methyltransferase domain-containing protein [Anaerolineae bacterium]MEB2286799.1 methyltransferase domain-containing protein [Anaerolineae bacterium]